MSKLLGWWLEGSGQFPVGRGQNGLVQQRRVADFGNMGGGWIHVRAGLVCHMLPSPIALTLALLSVQTCHFGVPGLSGWTGFPDACFSVCLDLHGSGGGYLRRGFE